MAFDEIFAETSVTAPRAAALFGTCVISLQDAGLSWPAGLDVGRNEPLMSSPTDRPPTFEPQNRDSEYGCR